MILAFESSETLRHLPLNSKYPDPDKALGIVGAHADTLAFDASELAAGSAIAVKVMLIGALAGPHRAPISAEVFAEAVKSTLKPSLAEVNLRLLDEVREGPGSSGRTIAAEVLEQIRTPLLPASALGCDFQLVLEIFVVAPCV